MSKSSSVEKFDTSSKVGRKNSFRPYDDASTLSAINQIVARSESIENATLDSLHFLFGPAKVRGVHLLRIDGNGNRAKVNKSSLSSSSDDMELIEVELQRELTANHPVLPKWPVYLELRAKGAKALGLYLWIRPLDPINSESQFLLALVFGAPVTLDANDLHALEVAASVLRHKIALGPSAPRVSRDPLEHPSRFRLSDRQVTISKMILAGLTNKEIAQELNLSAATIRYECVRLYERLGAKNRASAAAILQNLFSGNHNAVSQDF